MMKKYFFISGTLLISLMLYGQSDRQQSSLSLTGSEVRGKNYTLSGARHGVNFFPEVQFQSVQYVAGDSLTFDKYHSEGVIYTWLKRWAEKYPDLIDLYEVGRSYEGRAILQMTLTNKKTGKDSDKPALFFEGGRHSGEISGTESVLWLTKYLLDNYEKDPDVTHLILSLIHISE